MEAEIKNITVVWVTVLASLTYCYSISKFIPQGRTRFCSLIPIIFLFLYLPLNLNTIILGFITSFFISWLANFKLLLFAFGKGPLSSRGFSLLEYLLVACLPIKIKNERKVLENDNKEYPHLIDYYPTTLLLQAIMLKIYSHREILHPRILLLLYGFHFYLAFELLLSISATLAQTLSKGLKLEPGFNKPYLATSIHNFWGRRWNLVVSSILRQAIYDPVRSFVLPFLGLDWAFSPAVLATFFVSGLTHELLLYHLGRVKPTWDVTCLFLLQGIAMVAEIRIKKVLKGKFSFPRVVSTPLLMLFISSSCWWLLILPMVKCNLLDKVGREISAPLEFLRQL